MARKAINRRAVAKPDETANKRRNLIIGAAVAVTIIALGLLLYGSIKGPSAIRDLVTFSRPSRGHDNFIEFANDQLPPVGGTHHDAWQNCGIYDEPVASGNAVHSMEHGAVWITYRPDLADEDVVKLQEKVRGESHLLLSPYPNLQSPVVLSAWGLQLEVDNVGDKRVDEFIERYQSGPQTPERGAKCNDGVGQPLP